MKQMRGRWRLLMGYGLAGLVLGLAVPELAQAGGGRFLWNKVLDTLITELTGPVAAGLGTLAIAVFGFTLCFSDGGGVRVIIGILFGLSIAITAVSVGATFFGFTAGASW